MFTLWKEKHLLKNYLKKIIIHLIKLRNIFNINTDILILIYGRNTEIFILFSWFSPSPHVCIWFLSFIEWRPFNLLYKQACCWQDFVAQRKQVSVCVFVIFFVHISRTIYKLLQYSLKNVWNLIAVPAHTKFLQLK